MKTDLNTCCVEYVTMYAEKKHSVWRMCLCETELRSKALQSRSGLVGEGGVDGFN